jgi:hypothetical protein
MGERRAQERPKRGLKILRKMLEYKSVNCSRVSYSGYYATLPR